MMSARNIKIIMKRLLPKPFYDHFINITDAIFSLFILASILALLFYSGVTILNLFWDAGRLNTNVNIVHNIAYIVVLLKAYKILTFYLESHNLSIKYLVNLYHRASD